MAGLLSARSAPGDTNELRMPGGGDVEGEAANVTPEEQAQYDEFVNNALEIIYPAQTQGQPSPQIINSLSGQMSEQERELLAQADPPLGNSPIDNLAGTGAAVVVMVEGSAAQAGARIDDDVLFHAGADILAELAEVAEAAKIHPYSEEEMESALYRALDIYRMSSPRVDPEMLAQEFGQIAEADKAGQLDQVLPGIGQRTQEQAA